MTLIKIKDSDFLKDTSNGGVINTNTSAYKAYLSQRDANKKSKLLEKEIDSLKSEIQDLKELIREHFKR